MPPKRNASDAINDTAIASQWKGWFRRADRYALIKPAIGLRAYKSRHDLGILSNEYATGLPNIQICTRNGTAWRKSRYATVNAARPMPIPRLTTRVPIRQNGNATIETESGTRYHTMSPNMTSNEMVKSTSETP